MIIYSEYFLYTCLQFTFLTYYEAAKLLKRQGKFAWAMLSASITIMILVMSRCIYS